MGKLPVQEGTEELRLALVQLVEGPLIECTGTSLIGKHKNPFISALPGAQQPLPSIIDEVCC